MRGSERLGIISVRRDGLLRDVALALEAGAIGIALVIDVRGALVATLTDGDLRRAFIAGFDLATPVTEVLAGRGGADTAPIQASDATSRRDLLAIMQRHAIRQIPLHDTSGRVTGIVTLADLTLPDSLAPRALIMAGGFGKRMGSLTATTPKPLLPVAGRPLIERLVLHLRSAGITRIHVSVHHLAERITDHLGDGTRFDVTIEYVREPEPLGTAGAIGYLPQEDLPLLVLNGDLLTNADLRGMVKFQRETSAVLTMGVRAHEQQVPFGVVNCDGHHVHSLVEKPTYRHLVNGGIYLLEPEVCARIERGAHTDMPEVIASLLAEMRRVSAFPLRDSWLDVGRPDDYERAQSQALALDAPARSMRDCVA